VNINNKSNSLVVAAKASLVRSLVRSQASNNKQTTIK